MKTQIVVTNFKNFYIYIFVIILGSLISACTEIKKDPLHVWETLELTFQAKQDYSNPYKEVEMWVNLTGPENFNRRIRGFWDGGDTFKVRVTGIYPGSWHWQSESNQSDRGLNNHQGTFTTIEWTEEEKLENPTRRGFIEATENGRAWQYKDGTPFYMLADTWWAASTWRYPFKGEQIPDDYILDSTNFCFEGGIQKLKSYGFNSIGLITSHPHWSDDGPATVRDDAGIQIRGGKAIHNNLNMTMHSDNGHRAFEFPGKSVGKNNVCPDYDRLNPEYFKDLDKKMFYLNEQGFIPYVEIVRRDAGIAWEAYYDWPESYSRYINYIASRYSTINMIFSLLHGDTFGGTVKPEKWTETFDHWYYYYTDSMGIPFTQPMVVMGGGSTYRAFGHITDNPWLEAHSVGNGRRNHGLLMNMEEAMKVKPYIPGYCNEPYYVGWPEVRINGINGEMPPKNSDRDNYFGRVHSYGHMMNGGLAGHIIGTGSRWPVGPGEEYSYAYPAFWETMNITLVKDQARFAPQFLMSEGLKYRELMSSNEDLPKRKRTGFGPELLEGWSHMVKTPDNKLVLIYFEQEAQKQIVSNLAKNERYRASWFNPIDGKWIDFEGVYAQTDSTGTFIFPDFPDGGKFAIQDWAAKLVLIDN